MTHTHKWRVVAELAASQHGAFHRSQAASHLSTRTLRRAELRGDLVRPLSDVFVLSSFPITWKQRLAVLSLAGGLVSHRSAAALHGLDGFSTGKLEITVDPGTTRRWLPNTTTHTSSRIGAADRCEIDGITCTAVERTLIDLAQVIPIRKVEPALDAALRGGLTIDMIEAVIDRSWRSGPTGLGPLLGLLKDPAREGDLPESVFERLIERIVLDAGLPRPMRQFPIATTDGEFRVDLAWPHLRLAVEAHSKRWHFGRTAEGDDNLRDLALAGVGWEVLYVTWAMAQSPDVLLRRLRSVIAARAA